MEAKTLKATSVAQLEKKLFECLKHGYRPTLSMVFCAPDHDFAALSKIFDISDIDLLGCTTAGEIVNDELHESSIVVLLMDVKKEHYKMFFKNNNSTIFKTGKSVRDFAESTFTNPSMIVATAGVLNDGEQIVAGLKMGDGREIPIFGGLAGDNLNVKDTYVFSRREYTNDGMLAIVFDGDKVELKGLATSGWEALGSYHTITKAEGNVIYSINNEPALDYFIKFFGYHDDANVKHKPISTISAQYPLQVTRENSDYSVLRSPIRGDQETRSLTLVGSINQGDRFRFSISPGVEVIDKTILEFKSFQQETVNADALVLFSCKGRHAALGPFIEDEIKGVYDHWKKPMIGFLTYGEIGNLRNGICEFHNETCSLVAIRELV